MEKENNNKPLYIIIAILLFIIGLGAGYIMGSNKPDVAKEKEVESKKEDNEDKNSQSSKDNKEEKNPSSNDTSVKKGVINSDIKIGEKDSKKVSVNGKEVEISYEVIEGDEGGPGTRYLKVNNKEIGNWSPNGINDIRYETIKGSDGKEYLILMYSQWYEYIHIVNDTGEEIHKYRTYVEKEECGLHNESIENLIYINNNIIYYYRYKSHDSSSGKVTMELVELDINNDKVTIKETGETKEGSFGQCN